ncbi:MAG: putative transcriptional regulator, partial [Brevibacillus sp.]|nr:putative transcriptional regulator [Brevibacillus sp.]
TSELYEAAAVWCEQQELEEDAVDYYLAGHHYQEAIRLLEQMKSFMVRRQFSTLRVWLSAIPVELLREHHYLYFSYVLSLLWDNDPDLAEKHLQSAEEYFKHSAASWSREEQDRYLGNLYYIRNFKATKYDMEVVKGLEYIRLAIQHSPTGTDLLFGSPTMPLAPSILRSYNGKRGRHLTRELADPFFQNMIEFMTPMGIQASTVVCYGELLYERNELDQAQDSLKQGLRDTALTPHEPEKVYVPAYLFLSRISKARRDYVQARKWLEEVREKAGMDLEQTREAFILIDAEMAALRLDAGDLSAAVQWKDQYRVSSVDPVSVYQLFVYIFLLRVLTETGEYEAAWHLSEKLLYLAEKDHRPMDALEIQVLQAMILQRTGKPERAVLMLEVALEYAEPDDYIRVFLDKGQAVAELLIEYIQLRQKGSIRDKITPSLAYTRRILACFGGAVLAADQSETALETLLTKRELAVFRCMEEGLDNAAITEKLGIGMGTLKAHINRIYSKFQVTNRVEAIRRGKELKGL